MKKRSIRLLLSALLVLVMAFQSFAAPLSYAGPTAASEPARITGTWSTDASGSWRFNAQDGAAKDGWYYLNTTNNATDYNWFCFDANGVMRTGWVQDKNDPSVWYYTGESKDSSEGGLVKGWVTDPRDGKKYYMDPSTGIMCHGWKQISGVWYYFGESRYADRKWAPDTTGYWKAGASGKHSYGSLYMNEYTPDGYYVGANGAWVQNYREDDNSDTPDPIPEYSITVENDGNGTASASANKSAAGKEITLTAAPNEGYRFKEWNVVSGGVTVTENKFTMPAENVAVKAVFEEIPAATYTITYDANGATSGTAPAAQTKIQDEDLTLAANTGNLAKSVYRFAGWNTASDGTGTHYDAGATYTEDVEITLYAEWAEHKTIADVLATVDGGFPSSDDQTKPSDNSWVADVKDNKKCYAYTAGSGSVTALLLRILAEGEFKGDCTFLLTTTEVTTGENYYTASHSYGTLTFNMKDGVLTSFEFKHDNGKKDTFDGTYSAPETKKLSEILPSDFPTSDDAAWVNTDGKKAYIDGDNIKVGSLTLGKDTTVARSGDNYVCKSGDATVTFNGKDGAAESITVTGSSDSDGTYSKSQCIAAGTMISMPGGKQKSVEELEIGDVVCTFDHETGEMSSAPVCFIWESKNVGNAFTLTFEGDIEVTVIEEHGFYDQEEQKYVFINLQNAQEYIGDHFYHADSNNWLELKSCKVSNERVDAYAIITSGNLNHMSNGMLSMCDGTVKMIANIFEYDDRMRYDADKKKADIETYGLTPIEKILEFDGFIEADYVDYNLQYLNVAIGKGLTTWERIKALSDYCVANGLVCIEQTNDVPMLGTEEKEPIIKALAPRSKPESCEPEKFEEAKPEELIEPAEAVAEEAAP